MTASNAKGLVPLLRVLLLDSTRTSVYDSEGCPKSSFERKIWHIGERHRMVLSFPVFYLHNNTLTNASYCVRCGRPNWCAYRHAECLQYPPAHAPFNSTALSGERHRCRHLAREKVGIADVHYRVPLGSGKR